MALDDAATTVSPPRCPRKLGTMLPPWPAPRSPTCERRPTPSHSTSKPGRDVGPVGMDMSDGDDSADEAKKGGDDSTNVAEKGGDLAHTQDTPAITTTDDHDDHNHDHGHDHDDHDHDNHDHNHGHDHDDYVHDHGHDHDNRAHDRDDDNNNQDPTVIDIDSESDVIDKGVIDVDEEEDNDVDEEDNDDSDDSDSTYELDYNDSSDDEEDVILEEGELQNLEEENMELVEGELKKLKVVDEGEEKEDSEENEDGGDDREISIALKARSGATTSSSTKVSENFEEDLQGASRTTGGVFRGHATGNVYNFADDDGYAENYVPSPERGQIYLHTSRSKAEQPISMKATGSTLAAVQQDVTLQYSPIRKQNTRIYVEEDGAWEIKGHYMIALELNDLAPWKRDEKGIHMTLLAETEELEPEKIASGSHQPPASSEATQSGDSKKIDDLQSQLVTLLNIPPHLVVCSNNTDIRMSYAKYKGYLSAKTKMNSMVADGTWTLGTFPSDKFIEVFVSKST
jgi:hypothetical protein